MTQATTELEDVAAVLAFEDEVKSFDRKLDAIAPAIDRLEAVDYPGIGVVPSDLMDVGEALGHLLESIQALRSAKGDRGRYLYEEHVIRREQSLAAAEATQWDSSSDPRDTEKAVAAMRAYASTVSRPEWADAPATDKERLDILGRRLASAVDSPGYLDMAQRKSLVAEGLEVADRVLDVLHKEVARQQESGATSLSTDLHFLELSLDSWTRAAKKSVAA